jgi:hypothetical protein
MRNNGRTTKIQSDVHPFPYKYNENGIIWNADFITYIANNNEEFNINGRCASTTHNEIMKLTPHIDLTCEISNSSKTESIKQIVNINGTCAIPITNERIEPTPHIDLTSDTPNSREYLKRKTVNNSNPLIVHKIKKTLPNLNLNTHTVHISRHLAMIPVLTPPAIIILTDDLLHTPRLPGNTSSQLDISPQANHKRKYEETNITLPSHKSPKRPRSLCSPGTAEGESGQG